jgi:tRNA A37 threonylcarbamoyladenosine biosynthesis protein TsaE
LSSPTYTWFHDYLRSKEKIFHLDELFYCKRCTNSLYNIKRDLITIQELLNLYFDIEYNIKVERVLFYK